MADILPHLPFTPHPWQVEDIETGLSFESRFGMYLPVGSGKTLIATCVAHGWGDPTIIVTLPPILISQWVKWLNSIPSLGGAIAFKGPKAVRHNLPIEKYRWIVMSNDIFKNDYDLLLENYFGTDVTLIVDEAQCLKNPQSKMFKKVQMFAAGNKLILATGTELNSPGDAYSYIKLKTPLIYRNMTHFENVHVLRRDFFNKPEAWQGTDLIGEHLYKVSTKRTKEEVHAHLPKANYVPIEYDLEPAHLKLYTKLADEMLLELPDGGKIDGTQASALYNALQQTVVNWDHFAGEPSLRPAAFDLIDMVTDEIALGQTSSSKLIIWTWFKMTTRAVLDYCNEKFPGAAVAAYSGANSVKSVAEFLDNPKCLILVAQPGSAGAGLNPQHLCWESLFLEAPTVSIPFKQAAGRVDREGQKFNPTIRVAMARGTIQCSMFQSLLNNDAQVMKIQSETNLRSAIYGR